MGGVKRLCKGGQKDFIYRVCDFYFYILRGKVPEGFYNSVSLLWGH